ncbi:hypothetical protein EJ07DRAFT_155982 [Lizonia empirigonia]|nr:hypothetical protein EJ07DRAFT_155982 [Lizonia empirigonia]
MSEAISNAVPQTEAESTPVTNGTSTTDVADVTMADSTEGSVNQESHSEIVPLPEAQPEVQPEVQPELQPEVQAEVQPAPTPAHASAPTPTTAPAAPASSRNSPHPSAPQQAPTQPIPHGSPTRVYLNQHVTPHLLEAMKHLATTEPEKPLKFLSEFLAMKSAEIEG